MAAPAKTVLKMSHPVAANLNLMSMSLPWSLQNMLTFGDNIEVKIYPNAS